MGKTNIKAIIFTLLIVWGLTTPQYCQSRMYYNQSNTVTGSSFLAGVVNDFGAFANIPGRWEREDYLKVGALLGATGLFMLIDENVRSSVQNNHTLFNDNLTKVGKYYGNGIYPFALSGVLYFSGLAFENSRLNKTGKILAESLIASRIVVQFMKIFIGRSRPYMGKGNTFFTPFSFDNDFNSSPSGHTIIAFTTSTVLAEQIDNVYASIALYSLAALTTYQRIYSDQHWISDTVLGAVLGYSIGKFFVLINEKYNNEASIQNRLNFYPQISNNGLELGFLILL